ncbi:MULTISPECIES: LysR family transcriptional regulator [unclassified Undibacterium]|uniref:LysR family transcriptional regulator n=1 Tax=unclassified Undibacterium TaxID=2630295 RepID=UPI002AC9ABE5|nr:MULTISPECIES: LysR family transcriptional regulator [unclassified Undibacterium]MEB0140732.1 LysR family transcriptional regulator [Undibacterium sp. CCC2.1]MEB0173733.1 LysR family transcriptional regulator [Undibacterium sp. CCC1.1]MEB0178107.1 LysR family transcriptional regulator [Undibacterium sp. CCC3.4]MEB0216917.1 LysR family transcriptional regulator [Undibacterium sp. 5I2]WPX41982.1 LysR family transcriptional regulator [Undibacterium sp. CCC3.4]
MQYNTVKKNKSVSTGETMEILSENVSDIFIFVKVVELKSFSEAARVSGSTKSTVSKQVRRLEETLGAKLLNRTTRHLALTEAGELAYQHGLRIAEETTALRSALEGLQSMPRGHLRVTTSVAFGNLHLSHLIGQFLNAYPDISVALTLIDRYVDVVEEGFDIAIRLTEKPIDSFVARRLAGLDYVLCASPDYLRSHTPISTLEDLAAHNCMVNSLTREASWRFSRDGESREIRVTGRFSVNSSESLRRAVLDGIGIGLLPTYAIAEDLRAGHVSVILPAYRAEGRFGNSIYAIFLPSKFATPKMRVFVDFLIEKFKDGGEWG